MDLKEKMQKFNQRWKMEPSESYEESFKKFKTRILNILEDIDNRVPKADIALFCRFYGIKEEWIESMYNNDEWSKNIINRLKSEDNELEFYKLIELIFALNIQNSYGHRGAVENVRQRLYREVCEAIDFSNINLTTSWDKDGDIIFYPKGEELLDKNLVNHVLSFLEAKCNQHFVDSLQFARDKKWIKSAESLRRSLEEFLRDELGNQSGLAANITEIGKILKKEKNPPQIRTIVNQIFGYLDQFFNEHSKHNDGDIGENECEFMIYQVSLLMRYIHQSTPLAKK